MKMFHKKSLVLLVCVTLLLTFTVSGTVAFLADGSGSVVNTFQPTQVSVTVTDEIVKNDDGSTSKKNVVITNTSNIKAYIRAEVIANWCNDKGQVVLPLTDFSLTLGEGWSMSDGYYYYKDPVEAGKPVPKALFESYKAPAAPYAGLHLEMDIIVQAIQAEGMNVNSAQEAFAKAAKSGN